MAAVEEDDLARRRHLAVDAPEIVVRALLLVRRLPADRAHAERARQREDAADRSVLAARVGALQDDEHLEALVGVEDVLQLVDVDGERLDGGLVAHLVAERERLLGGIDSAQVEAAAARGRCVGPAAVGAGELEVGETRVRFLRQGGPVTLSKGLGARADDVSDVRFPV